MDITYNEWGMGYIYLIYNCRRHENGIKKINYTLKPDNNLSHQLNKLNWPDKKYVAARDEDFIEEFQNNLDNNLYIKGIEFEMRSGEFNNMIDNYQIKSFKIDDNQYYCVCFAPAKEIFDSENHIYAFSEKKDAFAIFNLKKQTSYKIAFFKALIFKEDSPYNIEHFKTLKIY